MYINVPYGVGLTLTAQPIKTVLKIQTAQITAPKTSFASTTQITTKQADTIVAVPISAEKVAVLPAAYTPPSESTSPSVVPSVAPSMTPSVAPSMTPTLVPTAPMPTPMPMPVPTPTPTPTPMPSRAPTPRVSVSVAKKFPQRPKRGILPSWAIYAAVGVGGLLILKGLVK